ncbi:MAG TPA: glycosyltransferase family 39 protein [Bryobacteraceae bacterium]|nr:glycosyltransferase family 39 protein [Bryobacteraceae bacterium]
MGDQGLLVDVRDRTHVEVSHRRVIRIEILLLVSVVLVGALIRFSNLSTAYLWADEAESSINALTILEHGYPTDQYLGIPIYENTLTEQWPGNAEYEFRDSSYSSKGVAVYHGWLPLYAIAASFAGFGVDAQRDATAPASGEIGARESKTFFARLPAVIFGIALLLALYVAGKSLYGLDAAWAALIIGALSPAAIASSRQARYYAATVLLGVLCGLAVWWMAKLARWRDFVAGGILFVLLFHTHILTFVALTALLAAALCRNYTISLQSWPKVIVFGCILTAGILPWLLWTGMLERAASIPKVWPLLRPEDIFGYPITKLHYTLLVSAGLVLIAVRQHLWNPLARRLRRPLLAVREPYLFVFAWLLATYVCFLVFTPAASFFQNRMFTLLGGPGILLTAMLFAVAGRALSRRHSTKIATAIAVVFVVVAGFDLPSPERDATMTDILNYVEHANIEAGTKLYAMPNNHLILTFYSGLPIQSTAPVRKTFFDNFPGRILILNRLMEEADPAGAANLQAAAVRAGVELSGTDAARLSEELASYDFRSAIKGSVRSISPPITDLPPFALGSLALQRKKNQLGVEAAQKFAASIPVTRGLEIRDGVDLWCKFFYRFADPDSRCGPNLNFADRLRTAKAVVIGGSWVLYDCPPLRQPNGPRGGASGS